MDESGGSGQPRSGTDESTDRRADRMTPATDPTRPDPAPNAEQPTDTQPGDTDRDSQDEAPRHSRGADTPSDTGGEADSENSDSENSGNGPAGRSPAQELAADSAPRAPHGSTDGEAARQAPEAPVTQQGPDDTAHDPTAPASP
ncbi:hypothetical protein PBV88_55590, partial [Streptomyces sp. T21Q-yed]|nr:hypothetical protein [Streptomyces sp. T21Q-yed]